MAGPSSESAGPAIGRKTRPGDRTTQNTWNQATIPHYDPTAEQHMVEGSADRKIQSADPSQVLYNKET